MIGGSTVMMGQAGADPDDGVKVWKLSSGADDDGVAFNVSGRSNWIQPALGGGMCAFYDAFVSITWTMAAVLRFKPVVDQNADSITWLEGTLDIVETDITLAAPGDGQRVSQTFRIPLKRKVMVDDEELTRNDLVGTRMQLTFESVDGLGVGDLILDGCEVEYEQVVDQKPAEG